MGVLGRSRAGWWGGGASGDSPAVVGEGGAAAGGGAVRVLAPSLSKIDRRSACTVRSLSTSRSAAALLSHQRSTAELRLLWQSSPGTCAAALLPKQIQPHPQAAGPVRSSAFSRPRTPRTRLFGSRYQIHELVRQYALRHQTANALSTVRSLGLSQRHELSMISVGLR